MPPRPTSRLMHSSRSLSVRFQARLDRSSVAKQLVTGLFDEVVSAHIAVSLPQLVAAFRATLPAERSGHALDNFGEHRYVLTNNTRMIPGDLTQQVQTTYAIRTDVLRDTGSVGPRDSGPNSSRTRGASESVTSGSRHITDPVNVG